MKWKKFVEIVKNVTIDNNCWWKRIYMENIIFNKNVINLFKKIMVVETN